MPRERQPVKCQAVPGHSQQGACAPADSSASGGSVEFNTHKGRPTLFPSHLVLHRTTLSRTRRFSSFARTVISPSQKDWTRNLLIWRCCDASGARTAVFPVAFSPRFS